MTTDDEIYCDLYDMPIKKCPLPPNETCEHHDCPLNLE